MPTRSCTKQESHGCQKPPFADPFSRGRIWLGADIRKSFHAERAGSRGPYGAQALKWVLAFGQASNSDQTKSRRIQAFDGRGCGNPTGSAGRACNNVRPSVPSLLTEDKSWHVVQDARLAGMAAFSPSMTEFWRSFGVK